jgi:hypothetical protein
MLGAETGLAARHAWRLKSPGEPGKENMKKGDLVSEFRQQILILHLSSPDLNAQTIAWALYDGAAPEDQLQMQSGDQEAPPYRSVLAAMRDGWFVIQMCDLPFYIRGYEHEVGHLPYEYVLERKVRIDG